MWEKGGLVGDGEGWEVGRGETSRGNVWEDMQPEDCLVTGCF